MDLSTLQEEFLGDHRVLTRGIDRILAALREGRVEEAATAAAELDRRAGAHMAFEEEVLYPRLGEERGRELVDRLLAEHRAGQRAIRGLVELAPGQALPDPERERIIEDLETALGHVLSCGTMVSTLGSGDSRLDDEALDRLRELRAAPERWTQRSYPGG